MIFFPFGARRTRLLKLHRLSWVTLPLKQGDLALRGPQLKMLELKKPALSGLILHMVISEVTCYESLPLEQRRLYPQMQLLSF